MGDLVALAEAVDAQLGLDLRWRGADLDRLLDEDHTAIVDALVGLYRAAGWQVVVEATFSEYGERGSIDVLAWHAASGQVAVNEVKASIGDARTTIMGIHRKARLAPIIARRLGWTCLGVSRFLVVAEGATARRRIARHGGAFRSALPSGGRECLAWIRSPRSRPVAGVIFLSSARGAARTRSPAAALRVRRRGLRTRRAGPREPEPPPAHREDE